MALDTCSTMYIILGEYAMNLFILEGQRSGHIVSCPYRLRLQLSGCTPEGAAVTVSRKEREEKRDKAYAQS